MSALSMASSTIASSPLHTKLSKLDFTHSFITFPANYLGKPFKRLVKPFKLNARIPCSISVFSNTHFHQSFAASFDGLETSGDEQGVELKEYEQEGGGEKEEEAEQDVEEAVEESKITNSNDLETSGDDQLVASEDYGKGGEGEKDEEAEGNLKTRGSSEEARLYVGNLPYSMTSAELTEVFQEAGRVSHAEVIYDRVTDRSRGFGFVTMASVEEAKEAIHLFNESQVGGRTVRVNFPEVPRGAEREIMGPKIRSGYRGFVDTPHKIYAGNLGWRLTSEGLRDAFAGQPGMLSAKVIYERDSGRSRGFGFVSFNSAEEAEAALNVMNGVEVEGRPLRLNIANDRPRAAESSDSEKSLESSELTSSIGA